MIHTNSQIKIILPIKEVPDDNVITKRTGDKKYKVYRKLTVYNNGNPQILNCDDGCKFLVPLLDANGNGSSINVIDGNTEVVWYTTIHDLNDVVGSDD